MEAELRAVFDGLWVALAEATGRRTPLTLGYLGTIGLDGTPQVRAVILRRTDHDDGAVYVATRADSAKVAEVGREPRVALTFVDGDAGVQLRLTGRARVVVDAGERALAWQGFADHNRALYRSALVPGSPLPSDPVGGPGGDGPGDEETEFARFAWVRIDVDAVDRLDLSELPHTRQRFRRTATGWTGSAVVP